MKWIVCFLTMAAVFPANAALLPDKINALDLDMMRNFIKSHRDVALTLESINVKKHFIVFGYNSQCKVYFKRSKSKKTNKRKGQRDCSYVPLEFDKTTCHIDGVTRGKGVDKNYGTLPESNPLKVFNLLNNNK